jgi:NAD(P) transhydrogenase subunit alpha
MVISVLKETAKGEKRVALTPAAVSKLCKSGLIIKVQKGAGENAHFTDERYKESGAEIVDDTKELFSHTDIILRVARPAINEINFFPSGSLLISFLYPFSNPELVERLATSGINSIAMDLMPRTTKAQKMDALSSQNNLAGYKAVLMAANEWGSIFPLLMTAAGTITPAKVLIMGAGVAGLQALGTAKRLGAVVEVTDIRPSVKEEVQSLGGKYIEVDSSESMQDERGYAKEASEEFLRKQKELIFKHVTEADIVITTALVPGKKAPVLVTAEMIKNMKPGSVVLDMAVEAGGNCELSEINKTVVKHDVKIIGEPNIASLVPVNASELYANNLVSLIQYLYKDDTLNLNAEDEIVKASMVTYSGKIINEQVLNFINKA